MPHELLRVLAGIYDQPWAITEEWAAFIMDVIDRRMAEFDALATRQGRPLDNTGNRVQMRGRTAILDIQGPIFRKASLFDDVSAATSVDNLARDFNTAVENPAVEQIVLNIQSPGGQVNGILGLGDQIREGAARKPVTAFVDEQAASGAYWLATAANRIVASESAMLGSIGVVATVVDRRDAQERQGVRRYEIVSSQSPLKRPDIRTEEGRGQIREMVDAMAELFIGRVARFRGTSPERVMSDFGRGKSLPAQAAVDAGMADEIGTFEGLLAGFASNTTRIAFSVSQQGAIMGEQHTTTPPAAPAPAVTPAAAPAAPATPPVAPEPPAASTPAPDARQTERARIAAILNSAEAQGRDSLARHLALETDTEPAAARGILAAAAVAQTGTAPSNPLTAAMAAVANPKVGVNDDEANSTAAEAAGILKFVPANRRSA